MAPLTVYRGDERTTIRKLHTRSLERPNDDRRLQRRGERRTMAASTALDRKAGVTCEFCWQAMDRVILGERLAGCVIFLCHPAPGCPS